MFPTGGRLNFSRENKISIMPNPLFTSSHDYQKLNTNELRSAFLIESLFPPGKVELVYTDADRAIVGSAMPGELALQTHGGRGVALAFSERRELGVLNVAEAGTIVATARRTRWQI